VDLAEEKLAALMEENRGLEERIELLQTPTEVERLAREQFGVVREGEIAYTVVTPEQERSAAGGRVAVPHPLEERTLLQRVWDFLTGRDLVDDG
jgi:hypothetical protein